MGRLRSQEKTVVAALAGNNNKGGYVATRTQPSNLQTIQNQAPGFENQRRGTVQHSFDHWNDQQYFESLTTSADRGLGESKELIQQTKGLRIFVRAYADPIRGTGKYSDRPSD